MIKVMAARTPVSDKKLKSSSEVGFVQELEEEKGVIGLSSPSLSLTSAQHRWNESKVEQDFNKSLWPALEALGWKKVSSNNNSEEGIDNNSKVNVVYCRPGVNLKEPELEKSPNGTSFLLYLFCLFLKRSFSTFCLISYILLK